MNFQKQYLDLVLVPSGLLIMFGYHFFLLYRCLHLPHTTVIGFENHDKKAWVERTMQLHHRDIGTALTVLSNNIHAATFLASVSLTLSSLIGAWIANNQDIFQSKLVYGDTSPSIMSIKYISLLSCFLTAFSCFVQSTRSFIHANYLISTPDSDIPVKNVELAVIRGGDFWFLGLRSLYFAVNMLLWFFGPIPMFVNSVMMALILHHHDKNSTPLHPHRSPVKQKVKMGESNDTSPDSRQSWLSQEWAPPPQEAWVPPQQEEWAHTSCERRDSRESGLVSLL
ncbi:uncharacterized protein LOC132281358 [Cornus florida]|uniref:uncharacterized protein LOC132281358 n=1 Tax=Cornus florida TaxID=4283 RepID=UPI00289C4E8B|nr:uncharacterized protein LOC132281358 [Cornus florida]